MKLTVTDPLTIVPEDPAYATLDCHSGSVACNSSGATDGEQYVETYVSMNKGNEKQSLSSIVCKIQGVTLGTDYTPNVPAPTQNYKKATNLNTGYVKITIKDGTVLISESVVITVTAVIDGESVSKDVTLTISGSKAGEAAERYWIEFLGSTSEVRINEGFAGENIFTPSSDTLLLKHLKGSTEESLSTVPSGYTMQYRPSGGSWQSITPGTRTFSTDSSDGAVSLVEYRLRKGSSVLSQISIHTKWEYQRMLLPAGVYTSKEYTRTSTTTPLVLHEASGKYWYLVADTNKVGNNIYAPNDANHPHWKEAENFEVVLTKMLFAQFAQLGGFIVVDNFFISRYGMLKAPEEEQMINSAYLAGRYYRISGNDEIDSSDTFGSGFMPAYTYFDKNDVMAENVTSDLKFLPNLCINAMTGEEYRACGKVRISSNGDVTMNNIEVNDATIKGSLMFHKVMIAYHPNNATDVLIADALHTALGCDILIDRGSNGVSRVVFPPAYLFPGARVRIINGTENFISFTLEVGRLNGEHPQYPDLEDAYNCFYCGIPFTSSDLYGERNTLTYDEYRVVELVSVRNPENPTIQPSQGVEWEGYVWMVIDTK